MNFTDQQLAIFAAGISTNTSIMVEADAGVGKTTTIVELARRLPLRPSLALAFNVKIKKELEAKLPKHFEVKTMNGLGHQAWARAIGKRLQVKDDKLKPLIKAEIADNPNLGDKYVELAQLVSGARSAGLIPAPFDSQYSGLLPDTWDAWELIADGKYIELSDELLHASRTILGKCIQQSFAGTIDFDDQIYMSALFGGIFPRFGLVMVDEAQDLSALNHIMLKHVAADRLIVVGDPKQAIYAFRGADSSSMENLRALRPEWIDLPLSITFRCPREIVLRQQNHAPNYTAAPSAPEGTVLDWSGRDNWSLEEIQQAYPNKPIAFLCRNNAPIISAALRIIRGGKGCTVLGSEIGKALVSLSRKLFPKDDTPIEACIAKILEWERKEIDLARANDKESRVAIIEDKAACLIAVCESVALGSEESVRVEQGQHAGQAQQRTSSDVRRALETMFKSESLTITLATGHKSKGLEWPVVIHLDPWRVPSKFALRAAQSGNKVALRQDLNLKYVIETRSKDVLILANLETFTCESPIQIAPSSSKESTEPLLI